MKKKSRLEELEEEVSSSENETTRDMVSYREMYEDMFKEWLDSEVEFAAVTSPYRIKSVREAARRAVDYFARASELGEPLVMSGATLALKLSGPSSVDLYRTYHPDMAALIEAIKDVCVQYAEKMLYSKVNSGAKFVLMNRAKWSTKEVSEVTTHNIEVNI